MKRIDELTVWNNFISTRCVLSEVELDTIKAQFSEENCVDAGIGSTDSNISVDKKYRSSKIMFITSQKYENTPIWELVQKIHTQISDINEKHFKFDLSYCEHMQLTQYSASYKGEYNFHADSFATSGNILRKLSFIIPLSYCDEYEGGELLFKLSKDEINVKRDNPSLVDKRQIIVFPSHLLHAITPVTEGIRYSLVGWVNGPRFK